MKQKYKNLLLRDLCARLPYGVIIQQTSTGCSTGNLVNICILDDITTTIINEEGFEDIDFLEKSKPYLRPMSCMTPKERNEFSDLVFKVMNEDIEEDGEWCLYDNTGIKNLIGGAKFYFDEMIEIYDWLNSHHFDYRGLIEIGLALKAPSGMYDIKGE